MATQVKTGLIANDAITDAKIANVALTGVTASSGDSSTSLATTAFVAGELNSLIDSAPGALNTLNELAAAMGDDAAFSTTVTNSIATKLPLDGSSAMTGNLVVSTSSPQIQFQTGASHYNWQIAAQEAVDTAFEISSGAQDADATNDTYTPRLVILQSGNVGIGITPRAKLDLKQQTNRTSKTGTARGILHLQDGDTPSNNELTAITFESNSNNASSIIGQSLTNSGSSLFFGTSNSYGSGVTNTGLLLDHNANATFAGNITAGNNGNINIPTASSGNANLSFDGNNFTIVSNSSSANLKLQTSSQDTITIAANGNLTHHRGTATFAGAITSSGNLHAGDGTNISMDSSANGQLEVDGNGYQGAIALDGSAMHVYHNSSSRSLVLGTNETARLTITGAGDISTNALSAVTTAGGGLWYDATNKYLSLSHWASSARPTPAAMLHLSDNSNDIDVPQIRIEGRENPGDTRLDIAVKDAEVRLNMVEGPSGDASVGYGLFTLKTNAAANTTYPRRGGFKFNVNTTTPVEILNTGTLQLHGNSADWSETTPGHTKGSIHLDPDNGTNNFGNAITFGASDHNNGESTTAGIYLRTDGAYGSKMYLATSDSYASGAKMAMRINHSGHIHAIRGYITSQVPAFNAYYSGNSFAPGGNYIFAANATRFNNGGNYSTSNYRFTAPVDGVYRFYFRTITNGNGSNQHLCFRKNGTDISGTNQHFSPNSGSAWCQLEMETVQDLSDGDWIDVRFVTLGISIHGNAWNEFSGHLIG